MRGKTKPGLKIQDFFSWFFKVKFYSLRKDNFQFFLDTLFSFFLTKKFPLLVIWWKKKFPFNSDQKCGHHKAQSELEKMQVPCTFTMRSASWCWLTICWPFCILKSHWIWKKVVFDTRLQTNDHFIFWYPLVKSVGW
jgi:hypothetical protein